MKQAIGVISNILFYVLIVVLLVLNASYTMTFTSELFPGDMIKIWGSLLLFDVGAVAWFLLFLSRAEGAGQRGVSLLMGVVDLVGSLIIAGAEVFGAASAYLSDPGMTAWLRETATYVLFIWLGINIASTWLYHVFAPHQQEAMMVRAMQDDVTSKALKIAGKQVEQMSVAVAGQLAPDTVVRVLAELGIKDNSHLLPASQQVIDVEPEPEPEHVKAQPVSTPAALDSVFSRRRPAVQQYQFTAAHNAPRQTRTPAAAPTTTGAGNQTSKPIVQQVSREELERRAAVMNQAGLVASRSIPPGQAEARAAELERRDLQARSAAVRDRAAQAEAALQQQAASLAAQRKAQQDRKDRAEAEARVEADRQARLEQLTAQELAKLNGGQQPENRSAAAPRRGSANPTLRQRG